MTLDELRERFSVRPGYWFKPKLFGWGVYPVTWQGWALTLALVAAMVAVARVAQDRSPVYLALLLPVVLAFAWIGWAKTDGAWRWRWGKWD